MLIGQHRQYLISGLIKVVMDDGNENEFGPEDTAVVLPSHNAWVVGNEPVVGIDFSKVVLTGLKNYPKEGGPQVQA
jgi:hypothetical protein